MIILRSVKDSDVDGLFELSKLVQFLNLPNDLKLIKQKVTASVNSFKNPSREPSENHFIFILEDLSKKKIIGVSMIHGQHGTFDKPHFFLEIDEEKTFSETLKKRISHQTLKLKVETDGPTEIGGLVVHPDYRKHEEKLGKQLSFIRFLFMGAFPEYFKSIIHSELMPPFDKDGKAPLWEAIGRKFFKMDYLEADKLSLTNKEFILNLFPSGIIYTSLLPEDAQKAIGEVGPDTLPVKKMLTSIGFEFAGEIDPFDGGPHYRAKLKDITIIKNLFKGKIEVASNLKDLNDFLVAQFQDNNFIALRLKGKIEKNIFSTENQMTIFDLNKEVFAVPC